MNRTVVFLMAVLLLLTASCSSNNESDVSSQPYFRPSGSPALGSICPCIKIDERYYYLRGISTDTEVVGGTDTAVSANSTIRSVLPDGFVRTAEIRDVYLDALTENYDMVADFEASGEVYENSDYPEAIYVKIASDPIDGAYVRFTTDLLGDKNRISMNGVLYETVGLGGEIEQDLPEGAVCAGEATGINRDQVPSKDLETNCPNAEFVVYVVPDTYEYIYITQQLHKIDSVSTVYERCSKVEI